MSWTINETRVLEGQPTTFLDPGFIYFTAYIQKIICLALADIPNSLNVHGRDHREPRPCIPTEMLKWLPMLAKSIVAEASVFCKFDNVSRKLNETWVQERSMERSWTHISFNLRDTLFKINRF